jgi:MFS family permease
MHQSVDKRAWLMVAMLFLFMLINFADKAVLGLAAGPIIQELKLTHTQFGEVGSSFFLFFSISAILVGFLVNRVSTKWTLTVMALIWALAQLPMIFVVGLPLLMANRIVLGAGEGPAYPVALHATYKWFPNDRRPIPTSVIALGGAVGTGIAAPAITYIIFNYSWHSAFGVLGVLGLAWVFAWILIGQEGPLTATSGLIAGQSERLPYLRLLTCRTVIGNFILGFFAYWLLTLAVVWLPSYLNKGAGYSTTAVGWIVTLPALCQILLVPGICAFSQKLKDGGMSSRLSRGLVGASAVLTAGLLTFLLPLASGNILPVVCTTIGFALGSVIFTLGHVMVAEVTPPAQRGAMLGINNAVATTAGIFAPYVMGMVVDVGVNATQGFRSGFMIAGAMVMVGAIIGFLLINPEADLARFARRGDGGSHPVSPAAVRA